MDLVSFILLCVVVGLLVWAVNSYLPIPPPIKTIILVAAVIVLIVILLRALGVLDTSVQIPRLR